MKLSVCLFAIYANFELLRDRRERWKGLRKSRQIRRKRTLIKIFGNIRDLGFRQGISIFVFVVTVEKSYSLIVDYIKITGNL